MKNTKIIALALGSCLILGSFAGCNKNEPSNSSESSSEAVTSSETTTTTSATSEDTKATGSEESKDTGSSEAADDDSEKIILDGGSQTYANNFITDFFKGVDIREGRFDAKNAKVEYVLSFAIMHLEIEFPEEIKVGEKGECSYGTISFDKARDVIGKYTMYVLNEDDCKKLPAPPDSYNASHANSWGPYYEDGKVWFQLGGGEIYNDLCVVDYAKTEEDGSMTLVFTVYAIDLDLYNSLNITQVYEYYNTTPDKAKSDKNLTKRGTGTANVSVGQSGDYFINTFDVELLPVE